MVSSLLSQKFGKFYTNERRQSFNFMGPSLFNSLPLYLRKEAISTNIWKIELDKFLEQIPDNPITLKISSGLSDVYTGKPTNSLLKWIPHLGLSGRRKYYPPVWLLVNFLWLLYATYNDHYSSKIYQCFKQIYVLNEIKKKYIKNSFMRRSLWLIPKRLKK